MAMYSASAEDRAVVCCLLLFQISAAPNMKIIKPVWDLLVFLQDAYLASVTSLGVVSVVVYDSVSPCVCLGSHQD